MAGRKRTGALAAGINVLSSAVGSDIERRLKREESDREFERKWRQAMTESAVTSGQLVPQFSTAGGGLPRITGFQQGQPTNFQGLLREQGGQEELGGGLPEGTSIRQTIKTPQGTITITRQAPKAATARFPTEQEARRLMLGAQPGRPFPLVARPQTQQLLSPTQEQPFREREVSAGLGGGLPSSPGGQALLHQLITEGATESPAARALPTPAPMGAGGGFPSPRFASPLSPLAVFGAGLTASPLSLLARGAEAFGRMRSVQDQANLPPDLPPAETMQEGTVVRDDATGTQYEVINGQWVRR